MMGRVAICISALAVLSACGDDLESRQAAVEDRMPDRAVAGSQPDPAEMRITTAPKSSESAEGFAEDGIAAEDTEVEVAPPEALVDDAQGFSTDPIDDTAGFDPSPSTPEGFAPEPMPPETFGE